jgi:L-ascorbate metabolism protein UlaG (beta-lactamase superfamily)
MSKMNIKIQYIYHSCFRVETEHSVFIFDYYQGSVALSDKNTYVFSSHGHPDHYNPVIWEWQRSKPNIKYILSSDIGIDPDGNKHNLYIISPYEEIKIDDLRITAYGSTDLGASFLVQGPGYSLFHAGDLNWWYWWQDTPEGIATAETLFKEEIAKIKGISIDLAFFPVDPRLEHLYGLGADYFRQEIAPRYLIPMHFGDDVGSVKEYANIMRDCSTKVIPLTRQGQEILL